jgi:hypothetical protein
MCGELRQVERDPGDVPFIGEQERRRDRARRTLRRSVVRRSTPRSYWFSRVFATKLTVPAVMPSASGDSRGDIAWAMDRRSCAQNRTERATFRRRPGEHSCRPAPDGRAYGKVDGHVFRRTAPQGQDWRLKQACRCCSHGFRLWVSAVASPAIMQRSRDLWGVSVLRPGDPDHSPRQFVEPPTGASPSSQRSGRQA